MMNTPTRAIVYAACVLCVIATTDAREPIHLQSGKAQTALVELYTSEGCSSCPPADAWMNRLVGHRELWKAFVPVAFHVDFWDNLGWKDVYARKAYSSRLRQYVKHWGTRRSYTPAFVVNGREWHVRAPNQPVPKSSSREVGKLRIKGGDFDHFYIHFSPRMRAPAWKVHMALLGLGIRTDVQAGENAGRALDHNFVVVAYEEGILTANEDGFETTLTLAKKPVEAKQLAVAAWVTQGNNPAPVQAVGGMLEE